MAGKVFFSVTMSLDGFMAPEAVPVEDVFSPEGQNDPRVQRWMTKWSELQAWLFPQRWIRENLKLAGPVVDPRPDPTGTHVAYLANDALRVVAVDGADDRALAEPAGPDQVALLYAFHTRVPPTQVERT
jgi:hypothetical protein